MFFGSGQRAIKSRRTVESILFDRRAFGRVFLNDRRLSDIKFRRAPTRLLFRIDDFSTRTISAKRILSRILSRFSTRTIFGQPGRFPGSWLTRPLQLAESRWNWLNFCLIPAEILRWSDWTVHERSCGWEAGSTWSPPACRCSSKACQVARIRVHQSHKLRCGASPICCA